MNWSVAILWCPIELKLLLRLCCATDTLQTRTPQINKKQFLHGSAITYFCGGEMAMVFSYKP